MAISESSQNFIYSVVDAQQEFMIKIFLLVFIIGLVLFLNKKYAEQDVQNVWQIFRRIIIKAFYYSTLIFVPMGSLLLVRSFSFMDMYLIILGFYTVVFSTMGVLVLVATMERVAYFLGFPNVADVRDNDKRKGEE